VKSCLDLREEGNARSGIYEIELGDEKRNVFCDMNTLGGGWTVIQRRGDFGNPPDFFFSNKTWDDYRNGFGRPDRELWLGLEPIFYLTNTESVQVRLPKYCIM
jgi:ficolin